jgi:hypothetical protein
MVGLCGRAAADGGRRDSIACPRPDLSQHRAGEQLWPRRPPPLPVMPDPAEPGPLRTNRPLKKHAHIAIKACSRLLTSPWFRLPFFVNCAVPAYFLVRPM